MKVQETPRRFIQFRWNECYSNIIFSKYVRVDLFSYLWCTLKHEIPLRYINFISTEYDFLYFLRTLKIINISIETNRTDYGTCIAIYTPGQETFTPEQFFPLRGKSLSWFCTEWVLSWVERWKLIRFHFFRWGIYM